MAKAVLLFSGGLDSMLSAKLLKNAGVEVVAVFFRHLFNSAKKDPVPAVRNIASKVPVDDFIVEDFDSVLFELVKNPPHGYGSAVNPCIDCKANMIKRAGEIMREIDADFVATGEVLGQRPMSQRKNLFKYMEKFAGLEGLVVRPLSLKLLPETIPERLGVIKRDDFEAIKGRSRKRQMELAEKFGFDEYQTPAGGCILTDVGFGRRLMAFFEELGKDNTTFEMVKLSFAGRILRFRGLGLAVVGRSKTDNLSIENSGFDFVEPVDFSGPSAVPFPKFKKYEDELVKVTAKCVLRYAKVKIGTVRWKGKTFRETAISSDECDGYVVS